MLPVMYHKPRWLAAGPRFMSEYENLLLNWHLLSGSLPTSARPPSPGLGGAGVPEAYREDGGAHHHDDGVLPGGARESASQSNSRHGQCALVRCDGGRRQTLPHSQP